MSTFTKEDIQGMKDHVKRKEKELEIEKKNDEAQILRLHEQLKLTANILFDIAREIPDIADEIGLPIQKVFFQKENFFGKRKETFVNAYPVTFLFVTENKKVFICQNKRVELNKGSFEYENYTSQIFIESGAFSDSEIDAFLPYHSIYKSEPEFVLTAKPIIKELFFLSCSCSSSDDLYTIKSFYTKDQIIENIKKRILHKCVHS